MCLLALPRAGASQVELGCDEAAVFGGSVTLENSRGWGAWGVRCRHDQPVIIRWLSKPDRIVRVIRGNIFPRAGILLQFRLHGATIMSHTQSYGIGSVMSLKSTAPRMAVGAAFALGILSVLGIQQVMQPAVANQPFMESALADLQDARGNLVSAEPNKGGHRERAIELVDRAIAEVEAGIAFAAD